MSANAERKSRDRVQKYRERKKAEGFRLLQKWVPDTRSPQFAAKARQEMRAIANSEQEDDDQSFIDSISELKF